MKTAARFTLHVSLCAGPELGIVNATHYRQGAVMKRYKEMFKTATICAFNPMIDDFLNARFFFGDSYNRYAPGTQAAERPNAVAAKKRLAMIAASMAIKPPLPAAPYKKAAINPPKNPLYPTLGGKGVRVLKKKF